MTDRGSTPDALVQRVIVATERWQTINPQELAHLVRLARGLPAEGQWAFLVALFLHRSLPVQEYAGLLLLQLEPPCNEPLPDLLRSVLPTWDRSVEQLPFYLAETFGRDAVLHAVAEPSVTAAIEQGQLEAVRFWLRSPRSGRVTR
jgi:hypothetical protein